MQKEYGGYLPIEINEGNEYYTGDDVMSFNCARSAFVYVIEKNNFKKVYLPFYTCESVKSRLSECEVDINYYHINKFMKPEINEIEESALIIITSFFGITNQTKYMLQHYNNIIFDNTQAFFQPPVMRAGIYNVYSCRKFVGVCDGAYLVGDGIEKEDMVRYVPKSAGYMADVLSYGTNAMYNESLLNEEQLGKSGVCRMSLLSQRILGGADYDDIIDKRLKNYYVLCEILEGYNEVQFTLEDGCVPMVYPFLYQDELLRGKLIDHHIYVPQWWKYILEKEEANEYEKLLSRYLLPLPIDQRYTVDDMKAIAETIKKNL